MHSNYLNGAFNQERLIRNAKRELRGFEFDAFIGMGLSGSITIPLLAYKMNKQFGIVRKTLTGCHSEILVEANFEGGRLIFVDDQICSGRTFKNVERILRQYCFDYDMDCKIVGKYMYGAAPGLRTVFVPE